MDLTCCYPSLFNITTVESRIDSFLIGDTIGFGSFGKVKAGVNKTTNQRVAVKTILRTKIKSQERAKKLEREIQNLWILRHIHVVELYEVISTPSTIFMIMEYLSGGDLLDLIVASGRLCHKDGRHFFQQIISGVNYCHLLNIVHRDLKPENILLDRNRYVKIADFGFSRAVQNGEFLHTSCGTPNYTAPEVFFNTSYTGAEADIWSCGIILYTMLCGKLPFDDDCLPILLKKIKLGHFLIPDFLELEVCDLISRILTVDPLERISINEILRHPWFAVDLPPQLFQQELEDETLFTKNASTSCFFI